jgi:hypothetical protein
VVRLRLHRPYGCGIEQTETLDGLTTRRCAARPPEFSPQRAVELKRAGLPGAAEAYRDRVRRCQ